MAIPTKASITSIRTDLNSSISEKAEGVPVPLPVPGAAPFPPPESSGNVSGEFLGVPNAPRRTGSSEGSPLRRLKRLPGPPSPHGTDELPSATGGPATLREKSPSSLYTLSDYDGSQRSHTERRFLRLYEELEAYSPDTFPEFITPWFLRRMNYGPCKAGDVVDLLRFLRPKGLWTAPFKSLTILDPYLAVSLEKAVYPTVDAFNPSQKALLHSLHNFIFNAYSYAQGLYFPFDGEWETDQRENSVDALNLYVEDVVALIDYIRRNGRECSLREFVKDRTESLHSTGRHRTFLFAEGGDTRTETETFVLNMFLALLGLWTVGSKTSDTAEIRITRTPITKKRFDYSKSLPYRDSLLKDISLIRETLGVPASPLNGKMDVEWVRPLQDFDAASIMQGPFGFALTRDVSRHMALDSRSRVINLFCEETVEAEDSPCRLEGNVVATILNLDTLSYEQKLIHTLLFSNDESRQIALSLGLVPPKEAKLFLRLSAFPNYATHLISLRRDMKDWRPRYFTELFLKGSQAQGRWYTYTLISIFILLIVLIMVSITGTIGVWIILKRVT